MGSFVCFVPDPCQSIIAPPSAIGKVVQAGVFSRQRLDVKQKLKLEGGLRQQHAGPFRRAA